MNMPSVLPPVHRSFETAVFTPQIISNTIGAVPVFTWSYEDPAKAGTLIEIEVPQTPPKPAEAHIAACLKAMKAAVASAELTWG